MNTENNVLNINNLPNEILTQILSYLTFFSTGNLLTVNKIFYENFNPSLPDKVINALLSDDMSRIYLSINDYKNSQEYFRLKIPDLAKADLWLIFYYAFITDDINTIPVNKLKELVECTESPFIALAQKDWEKLKKSIDIIYLACGYANSNNNQRRKYKALLEKALPSAMCFVNLASADMQNLNFTAMRLSKVNCKNVNLQGAFFINSTLEDLDFQGANLKAANFSGAIIKRSSFKQAKLKGTHLVYDQLDQVDLTEAHLIELTSDPKKLKKQLDEWKRNTPNTKHSNPFHMAIALRVQVLVAQTPDNKKISKTGLSHPLVQSQLPFCDQKVKRTSNTCKRSCFGIF